MPEKFVVQLSRPAEKDFYQIAKEIATSYENPYSARKILDRLVAKIESLEYFPEGYSLVNEIKDSTFQHRRVHVKQYNIYFYVDSPSRTVWTVGIFNVRRNPKKFFERF